MFCNVYTVDLIRNSNIFYTSHCGPLSFSSFFCFILFDQNHLSIKLFCLIKIKIDNKKIIWQESNGIAKSSDLKKEILFLKYFR
jgi:hypothetical protein